MDGPMPSSLVETLDSLEDPRVDRTKWHPLTDILVLSVPGHLRGRQFRGDRPLRPAQRGLAAHLPGTAARHPLARHAGTGLCAAGCGPLRGRLSGLGAGHLCPDRRSGRAHRRQERARLPRPGSGMGPFASGQRLGPNQPAGAGPDGGGRPFQRNHGHPGAAAHAVPGGLHRDPRCHGLPEDRLRAQSGHRKPTTCCAYGPTIRASTSAWKTPSPWNGPRISPTVPTTTRTRSGRTTGALRPAAAGRRTTPPTSPMSIPTGSGATWPAWSGSSANVAAGTGSRPIPAVSSRPAPQGPAPAAGGTRAPGIENTHHWVLDVALGEDDSRIRTGHAAHNMAILKRIAHNLLRQDRSLKVGIANKRLAAAWNKDYLCRLIGLKSKPV